MGTGGNRRLSVSGAARLPRRLLLDQPPPRVLPRPRAGSGFVLPPAMASEIRTGRPLRGKKKPRMPARLGTYLGRYSVRSAEARPAGKARAGGGCVPAGATESVDLPAARLKGPLSPHQNRLSQEADHRLWIARTDGHPRVGNTPAHGKHGKQEIDEAAVDVHDAAARSTGGCDAPVALGRSIERVAVACMNIERQVLAATTATLAGSRVLIDPGQ